MTTKTRLQVSFPLALFITLFVLVITPYALPQENGDVGSVEAIVIDETVRSGIPQADEGETRWVSNFPEHPELYIPMPIPEPTEPETITQPERRLVSYNMITGEETIAENDYIEGLMSAWVTGSSGGGLEALGEGEEGQPQPLNFTDLSWIPNPEVYPWRVNCKIYISFAGGNYVASGSDYGTVRSGCSLHPSR